MKPEIITPTNETPLARRFRLYKAFMAGVARREAEAAVGARVRPAAAPSLFRDLRPGDQIVRPASGTITTSTTTTKSPLTQAPTSPRMLPPEAEPVAAILDRRRAAAERMAAWLRGDGRGASRAPRPEPGAPTAGPAPAAPVTQPAALLPVAEIFACRFQRTIARARED